ncbi:hypothetical protein Pla52o_17470 [Novipirellula galeiformis]|uniref:Uncharacterized protein n=1 Tax=Novipirellula galeiformis TaxID=2528004 RepID=A0A5C6CQR6_9BACT|nr:hypothetical protein Pla52o_17470 [Novipirellula galeiformis]
MKNQVSVHSSSGDAARFKVPINYGHTLID